MTVDLQRAPERARPTEAAETQGIAFVLTVLLFLAVFALFIV